MLRASASPVNVSTWGMELETRVALVGSSVVVCEGRGVPLGLTTVSADELAVLAIAVGTAVSS